MEGMHPAHPSTAASCARCAAIGAATGLLSEHRIELDPERNADGGRSPGRRRCFLVACGVLPGAAVHAGGIALAQNGPHTELAGMILIGLGAIAMVTIPAFLCYRPRFSSWQQISAARENHGGAAAAGV